jgi:hypothetical protein
MFAAIDTAFRKELSMKSSLVALALVMTASLTGAASASDTRCTTSAQKSMSIEAAIGKAEALGYAISKTKQSKGCWKIEGYDRNGAEIELVLDPASGQIVKPTGWRAPAGNPG